jgi:selenocysteine-specific elongation factor
VATAGHVDHGKSTLVRALTGTDPDRWAEEHRRGLTLDLGFAWTTLPGGEVVAFVDVPGHERFVPTMLAGVGNVPAVVFVVAADEGWRRQSEEHLAALDALRVRDGVLVITRCDLADPRPATVQALARLASTTLAGVPSVAVSARTGTGLDELRAALAALDHRMPAPDTDADPRLWVDRSFTIRGAGTVVTGTLAAGTLRVGQDLELAHPQHGRDRRLRPVRVRRLQSLGQDRADVAATARVAVNLRGADHREIARGDALLAPSAWRLTTEVDVAITLPADAGPRTGPAERLPAHLVLHVGAATVPARVRPLGPAAARLSLDHPLPLRVADRGLLRDPGRHRVAAGVRVLDVAPPRLARRGSAARRGAELAGVCTGDGVDIEALAALHLRERGLAPAAELAAMGLPESGTRPAGGWCADPAGWAAREERAAACYDGWRRDHPLEPGMAEDVLTRALGLPDPRLLEPLLRRAGLVTCGGLVRRPGESPAALPTAVDAAVVAVEADLARAPFAAPDANRLKALGLGPAQLAAAVRAGRLVRIADGVVLLPDVAERAAAVLAGLPEPFTVSQARQALGTTRRVAVPLMEWLDRAGRTERMHDDARRLRRDLPFAVGGERT